MQSYCDDECRAKDGASKRHATGAQVSPSILASLPALLASHITLPTRPRDQMSGGGGGGGSTSSTSRSEESSPLQSPSPFAHPDHAIDEHNSPKEDAFMLPGPAYPQSNTIFGAGAHGQQNTYTNATPIKIIAAGPLKTQGFLPTHGSLKNDLGAPIGPQTAQQQQTQQQPDSTLHYGRRPGHTNSVTSPLALFPVNVGGAAARRRESHGAQSSVPAARPSPHGLSPLTKPIRLVSDSMIDTGRSATQPHPFVERRPTPPMHHGHSPLQEPTGHAHNNHGRRQFAYGMHSPLIVAANATTAAVDFSHAERTPSKVGSVTTSPGNGFAGRNVSSSPKQRPAAPAQSTRRPSAATATVDNSLMARRRSFPVQLIGSLRSQLMSPAVKKSPASGAMGKSKRGAVMASDSSASHSESDEEVESSALISSTELERPAQPSQTNNNSSTTSSGRPDDRGRGRSRAMSRNDIREESRNPSTGGPQDAVAESRRHLGIGQMDRNYAGHSRSSSRLASRGGSSSAEREARRSSRAGGRSRDRSRGRSTATGGQQADSDAGPPSTRIPSVPLPNMHNQGSGRGGFHAGSGGELSTIIGSFQQSQEATSPTVCEPVRGGARAELRRLASDGVESLS
ncbi:hypothetical protein QFC22_000524 [Naganishia vaughanmartiniae]|uniref:Uncharacterized protein n=1 Tax=Naganishia vaughanmartiniae TaxID=1424756 RepID=A0ACC2XQM1_9TREE|nr:hypothetical protein QFC22_000524 [Naganishia vaughanmartiniae]